MGLLGPLKKEIESRIGPLTAEMKTMIKRLDTMIVLLEKIEKNTRIR